MYTNDVRQRCSSLRRAGHSLNEIAEAEGVAKSTLSLWFREVPLDQVTKQQIEKAGHLKRKITREKKRTAESLAAVNSITGMIAGQDLDRRTKGRVAETATKLRLELHGYEVYQPASDGSRADFVVCKPDGRCLKIQVKCVRPQKEGRSAIRLTHACGTKSQVRYSSEEVDVFVGFDLQTNSAYVWLWDELREASTKTISNDALERWDKLA